VRQTLHRHHPSGGLIGKDGSPRGDGEERRNKGRSTQLKRKRMGLQNAITAIKQPHIIGEYAIWLVRKLFSREGITKRIRGNLSIAGFSGFSEYLAVDNFLKGGEFIFFQDYPFDPGAFIDIGANIGIFSLVFAKRFPHRPIYAVEASPYTLATLRKNIEINSAENIRAFGVAISDQTGTVTFNADPVRRGTAGIVRSSSVHAIELPCQSLDEFVAANVIGPIAAIKIDVEGYETLALRGGQSTLATNPPKVIFFEVCPEITDRAGFAADEPSRLLLDAGYSLFRASPRGELVSVEVDEIARVVSENWIAVRKYGEQS
jgi:FkbM family methyltransferase